MFPRNGLFSQSVLQNSPCIFNRNRLWTVCWPFQYLPLVFLGKIVDKLRPCTGGLFCQNVQECIFQIFSKFPSNWHCLASRTLKKHFHPSDHMSAPNRSERFSELNSCVVSRNLVPFLRKTPPHIFLRIRSTVPLEILS